MSTTLWTRIQKFLGITADGVPGNQTAQAVAARLGIDATTPTTAPSDGNIDPRSAANIATRRPEPAINRYDTSTAVEPSRPSSSPMAANYRLRC